MSDRDVQSWYDEQQAAWSLFDYDEACLICGVTIDEFKRIRHYRWHMERGEEPGERL